MKTAIIYASMHGTTEMIAKTIAAGIQAHEAELINLNKTKNPDLLPYELLIIGGSIHAGNIQKKIKKFITSNLLTLLDKKTALFLCCMDFQNASKQFEKAFPEVIRNQALSTCLAGGEFKFKEMNFFQRFIVNKISGIKESISNIDFNKVNQFILEINAIPDSTYKEI